MLLGSGPPSQAAHHGSAYSWSAAASKEGTMQSSITSELVTTLIELLCIVTPVQPNDCIFLIGGERNIFSP